MPLDWSWKKVHNGLSRRRKLLAVVLGGFVLPWAGFVLLAQKVRLAGGFAHDKTVLAFLRQSATPGQDKLAVALTDLGDSGPMITLGVLVALSLTLRRHRRQAVVFTAAVGGSMVLTQVLKALFARPRPDLWVSIKPVHTFSFPSGHAMDTAALATAGIFLLWQFRARWLAWPWLPLFALGVGWSRMYLGVHYPSDVLAGWLSATGWVTGVYLLFAPVFQELSQAPEAVNEPPRAV
ncbi:phosphatase PAP2 family protein [Hymenobacter sp. BT664]|uniref:Phosphatase PAP2 family protein n=1 Tax=Hymenobacter montanus TaxID=2771359 RepID=A0A927GKE4_9BACT|nr:phosphatase PAP2 family protein [Hymenobacter montanus]MBD2769493.1 phosphatase PAP2 family protein [Hymenobacter montanus]